MKILLISYFAPPYNSMGAIRILKIANQLKEVGFDVRIISGTPDELPKSIDIFENSIAIKAFNFRNIKHNNAKNNYAPQLSRSTIKNKLSESLKSLIKAITFPDLEIFWAIKVIKKNMKHELFYDNWKPDIIYGSCLPISSGYVAKKLAKDFDVPYIVEFRDRWANTAYLDKGIFRKLLEGKFEKYVCKSASGIVGVSRGISKLGLKYQVPFTTVYTGIDETTHDHSPNPTNSCNIDYLDKNKKTILYTGMIYPNRRDPSQLIRLFKNNTDGICDEYQLIFIGRGVKQLFKSENEIPNSVFLLNELPHQQIQSLQEQAHILLLLTWDHPMESEVISGKFFEYIHANKPILHIGYCKGEVSTLISDLQLGISIKPKSDISLEIINRVAEEKNTTISHENLTTKNQVKGLVNFFRHISKCRAVQCTTQ